MFVVFEGIDGSGKTTISNRAAGALRARGLTVEHVREGGAFASGVTQRIRDFCRDARNLALTPRAEFLLYVAREVQLGEEALAPALGRADVVFADRYLYTAEVLASAGRDLPDSLIRPVLDSASGGLWPDLVILIDVDPSVARGRRKVSKIQAPDARPSSRKGLAGSGLQQRLREGYRALAAREPGRWIAIDNTDEDLTVVLERVIALVERARAVGVPAALAEERARYGDGLTPRPAAVAQEPAAPAPVPASHHGPALAPEDAMAAFLSWVDRRGAREPALAGYVLAGLAGPGVDERRAALAPAMPRVVARGLRGLADPVSWQLRELLADEAPDEVALSLEEEAASAPAAWALRERLRARVPGEVATSLSCLDDDAAWAMREALFAEVPDAVMASLVGLDVPRAWALRERWIAGRGGLERLGSKYEPARAAARSVMGLEAERAWEIRKAAREGAPVNVLSSLRGTTSDRSWRWRERSLDRAPKPVLGTIGGSDDPRAWAMRVAMAQRCREAVDSLLGMDQPTAWEIREACLELWPATVVKSLGPLVAGARGRDLLARALERFPNNISLLKQAAAATAAGFIAPSNILAA